MERLRCALQHCNTFVGNVGLVQLLLERDAAIEATDSYNHTVLHYAIAVSHLEIVQLLVNRGAEIKATVMSHTTALHIAISCRNRSLGTWNSRAFLGEEGGDWGCGQF